MVIGLWALVLLPMWLRRHDQFNEGKQVDRFKRAMSSLGMSHNELIELSTHRHVSTKRAVKAGVEVQTPRSAAARRRRALSVLLAVQLVGLVAAMAGLGTAAAVVPLMLIGGFLTLARTQVRIERERRGLAAPTLAQQVSRARSERNSFLRSLAVGRAARNADDVVEQAPAAPTVAASDATPFWMPVQTVAPSYINAPAATAVPRAIDADGGWTGSAMVEAARAMAEQNVVSEPLTVVEPAVIEPAFDPDATTEIPIIRITA